MSEELRPTPETDELVKKYMRLDLHRRAPKAELLGGCLNDAIDHLRTFERQRDEARDNLEYAERGWKLDKRILLAVLNLLNKHGIAPGSKEIIDAARRNSQVEQERDEAREAMQWRPIESVPKDGRWIIVYGENGSVDNVAFAAWRLHECPAGWHVYGPFGNWCSTGMFTYWMPLPQPPVVERGEG